MNYDRRDAFARANILSRGNHKNAYTYFLIASRYNIVPISQFYTKTIFAGESRTRVYKIRIIYALNIILYGIARPVSTVYAQK